MIIYKICNSSFDGKLASIRKTDTKTGQEWAIPIDVENLDYQNFKAQINDESAQLETAEGVLMTPEEAKAYVATLP
jgi:hypothetical protein